ncbi:argininosuccinate lyase [Variovorax sp. RT4R15]|uniref:argininosuccinate lyase n=1 Tax=Variovorax sp. RT4R15 TaxID=3443737 RepID=UPI003F48E36A
MTAASPAPEGGLLWGGRFESGPDAALMRLSTSPPSYFRLAPQDLRGCRAHARELERAGLLDAGETVRMLSALDEVEADIATGRSQPQPRDEDVHTFIERLLTERLGALGGKLRAGRSRNDQTANDLRLYLREQARGLGAMVLDVVNALMAQADLHKTTLAPGFTHLQPAQPIVWGHQLLAHAQALSRDVDRLHDWDWRSARSPLGAAALAGSAIAMHPELAAQEMGYLGACDNSIDAVASRDHVNEFLFVAAQIGVDLSRLCEEICLWCSRQFGWLKLDDGFSTGSSIMPQKKNPDIAELTRGISGRLIGNLTGLLATCKSLPLAYNRDLFADKHAVFDSIDGLTLCLPAMAGMVRTWRADTARMRSQAGEGFTLATEIADWLARQGTPFASAHEVAGAAVLYCERRGMELEALTADDLAAIDARLTPELLPHISLERAVAARSAWGGTAPGRVAEQLARLQAKVAAQRHWAEGGSHSSAPENAP